MLLLMDSAAAWECVQLLLLCWQRSSAASLPVGCQRSSRGRRPLCSCPVLLGLLCPLSSFIFQCMHQLIVLDNQVDCHRIAEAAPAVYRPGVPAAAAVEAAWRQVQVSR